MTTHRFKSLGRKQLVKNLVFEKFHSDQRTRLPLLAAALPMCLNGPLFSDPPPKKIYEQG